MEHSKEPWKTGTSLHGKSVVFLVGDEPEHTLGPDGNWIDCNTEANARRIVACVNYCAGQPTETLEWAVTVGRSSIEHLAVLAGMLKTAERQRDELLAVLEAMLEEVAGCYYTTEAEARAVIQKVRGGE